MYNYPLQKILFLDIETVSQKANYLEIDETFQELWKHKSRGILKKYDEPITDEEAANTYESAGIYAEFGKIICISVGFLAPNPEGAWTLRLKSFANDDEKQLLTDFCQLLQKPFSNPNEHFLCGHNLKEFDIPYICRRMLINQMPLPPMLNISGKKPWETKHLLDTLEMWKFGDGKNYTSLKLLCAVFGFPSPKDDIDGSEVGRVYWQENNLDRIAVYCEKDVLAVVQLYMRYHLKPLLTDEQVIFVGR
jgi:3'-5' exonuclease